MNAFRLWLARKILLFLFEQPLHDIRYPPLLGIVVIKCHYELSQEGLLQLQATFKRIIPNQKIIVLEPGMDITVI